MAQAVHPLAAGVLFGAAVLVLAGCGERTERAPAPGRTATPATGPAASPAPRASSPAEATDPPPPVQAATPAASSPANSPCRVQDGRPLAAPALRAVGTEPFWGARSEGRCVTYSHPDDPQGTRVWTRYTPGAAGGGVWTGALGSEPFVMTVRPEAGCSDGMSDRRYPFAAELRVGGEVRRGCAEPG